MGMQTKKSQVALLSLYLLSGLVGCSEDSPSTAPEEIAEGSWMTYSPYKWTHDGAPFHGEYCIVYSDGATYDLKRKVSLFADEKFTQVIDIFDFDDMEDLLYPPSYDKVDVYINRFHEESIAAAWWGSFFITIRSADVDIDRYDYLFRHELTHVFQFLIEGHVNLSSEVWFTEGIAIYGGGGLWGIQDVADLEQWIASNAGDPNHGNPICIHVWDDFPTGADVTAYYYNVFDLTTRYLLDSNGLDKSILDVLNLFYDLRNDVAFPAAFQAHFGLTIETFENEYYERMRAYLSAVTRLPVASENTIGVVALEVTPRTHVPMTRFQDGWQATPGK